MVERFSIVKKINMERLDEKIADFISKNGYDPCIFVNNEMLKEIVEPCRRAVTLTLLCGKRASCLINRYHGYRLFEDNTLDFGEIELR